MAEPVEQTPPARSVYLIRTVLEIAYETHYVAESAAKAAELHRASFAQYPMGTFRVEGKFNADGSVVPNPNAAWYPLDVKTEIVPTP